MLRAEAEIEAAFRAGFVLCVVDVQRGTTHDVRTPLTLRPKLVGELEVEGKCRNAVADANLDVWPERDVIDKFASFDVSTEVKLIRVDRRAGAYTSRDLRGSGNSEQKHEAESSESFHHGLSLCTGGGISTN